MMDVWLKKLGADIQRRLSAEKRESFAKSVGISRQMLTIIEHGHRSYGVEELLRVLAGPKPYDDPVLTLLSGWAGLNTLTGEEIKACYSLVAALNDSRGRETARLCVKMLEAAVTPQEAGNVAPLEKKKAGK